MDLQINKIPMKKILTVLLGLMLTLSASAELFLFKYEGTRLTYKIIDEKERTCAVSLCGYVYGDVVIPEIAKNEDVAYRVIAIDNYAFSESELKSIVIPESVTEIGHSAFEMSSSLESVTLPSTITTIKYDSFNSCSSLTSISIPSSVTSIDEHAFYGCSDLSTVSLGESLESIGKEAFNNCTSLSSVSLPESLTEIKDYAFYETGLTAISLPSSLKTIGIDAFTGTKLTTVTIPASVTKMSGNTFEDCSNLEEINVDSGNPKYESKDGILYDKGMRTLLAYPGGREKCEIPSTVEYIGSYAFGGCRKLETVVIPENVVGMGFMAFSDCSNIQRLTIPGKVKEIGSSAFYDLRNLKEVYYNTTEVLDLGDKYIFSFYCLPEATLYVAPGGLESAKSTSPWRDFGKIEEFDFSKADEIPADTDSMSATEILTLDGKRVAGDAGSLAPGIYIIRQGGKIKTRAVK